MEGWHLWQDGARRPFPAGGPSFPQAFPTASHRASSPSPPPGISASTKVKASMPAFHPPPPPLAPRGAIVFWLNARAEGGGYRSGLCPILLSALRAICCLFSVSAYFPLMDIDLDMPHAVPDDSDDDEGDDPLMNFTILAMGMRRRTTMTSPPSSRPSLLWVRRGGL